MDVGAKLKEARLAKGLSLDSLQETTKIQKRYLVAIEEGNLHILPGKFYARAFIKEYANAVGIDSRDLLEEYKEEIPSTEEEEEENVQYTRMQRTRKESNADKGSISSFVPTIIVVLLIIGILFVAWWFIRENMSSGESEQVEEPQDNVIITNPGDTGSSGSEEEQDEDTGTDKDTDTSEEDDSSNEANEEEQSEAEITVTEEGTGSSPESTLELNNAPDEVTVTLESADPDLHTWLEIKDEDSGESFYNASFNEEASPVDIDVSDSEKIYFNVGNAPALKILINGVELEYPVDASQFVHQRVHITINKAE